MVAAAAFAGGSGEADEEGVLDCAALEDGRRRGASDAIGVDDDAADANATTKQSRRRVPA